MPLPTQEQISFAQQVKSRLALYGSTLVDLAAAVGANRVSVSRAINHPPRNPELARRIREKLDL